MGGQAERARAHLTHVNGWDHRTVETYFRRVRPMAPTLPAHLAAGHPAAARLRHRTNRARTANRRTIDGGRPLRRRQRRRHDPRDRPTEVEQVPILADDLLVRAHPAGKVSVIEAIRVCAWVIVLASDRSVNRLVCLARFIGADVRVRRPPLSASRDVLCRPRAFNGVAEQISPREVQRARFEQRDKFGEVQLAPDR